MSVASTGGADTEAAVRFLDEKRRDVLFQLIGDGILCCYVDSKPVVPKVKSLFAEGPVLHVFGKRSVSSPYDIKVPSWLPTVTHRVLNLFGFVKHKEEPVGCSIIVGITSARGLRNADTVGLSDPYCTCMISGKPRTKIGTHYIDNNLNPEWDYMAVITGYNTNDSLVFTVWDKDWMAKDDCLGHATLTLPAASDASFEGELPLIDAGKGVEAFLKINVARVRWRHSARGSLLDDQGSLAESVDQLESPHDAQTSCEAPSKMGVEGIASTIEKEQGIDDAQLHPHARVPHTSQDSPSVTPVLHPAGKAAVVVPRSAPRKKKDRADAVAECANADRTAAARTHTADCSVRLEGVSRGDNELEFDITQIRPVGWDEQKSAMAPTQTAFFKAPAPTAVFDEPSPQAARGTVIDITHLAGRGLDAKTNNRSSNRSLE